jgi:hypothetical protein
MQLPDTAAWFCASKTGFPVEYDLPSTTRCENRMGSACWTGSEQSTCCCCRVSKILLALILPRPRATNASTTVEWRRPAVISGRGVLTGMTGSEGGGMVNCDDSGEA